MEKLTPDRARTWGRLPVPSYWYADYDYVRLTVQPGDGSEYRLHELEVAANRAAVMHLGGESVPAKKWSFQGYRGWVKGKVAFGTSGQGGILQASGYAAGFVADVAPPWDNVARLDIQITSWYENDESWVIGAIEDRLRAYSAARGVLGAGVESRVGRNGGRTCYSGARGGDIYLRSYDKCKESEGNDEFKNAVRHEAELSNGQGGSYWPQPGAARPKPEALAAVVCEKYRGRGVWLPKLAGVPYRAYEAIAMDTSGGDPLAWYRSQVAPSIRKAISSGYSVDAILQALGIDTLPNAVLQYRSNRPIVGRERIQVEE